jgi:pilus assembly protein CpaC
VRAGAPRLILARAAWVAALAAAALGGSAAARAEPPAAGVAAEAQPAAPAAPAPEAGAVEGDGPEYDPAYVDYAATPGARPSPRPGHKPPPARRSRYTEDKTEQQADRRELNLTEREERTVDIDFPVGQPKERYIQVGDPSAVLVEPSRVQDKYALVFKPLKNATTTVTVRDETGEVKIIFTVHVSKNNLVRRAAQVKDLLRDIEGIDVRVVGNRVVIDGEVLVPADYGRLLAIVSDDETKQLLNLATLSPIAMQLLSRRIQEDINTFAPNVKTRVVNGMIFLEGTTDNIDQARRAEEVAKLYLPEIKPLGLLDQAGDKYASKLAPRKLVQTFIVVNPPPPRKQDKLVRVTLHFVELAKDYNKLFGFAWKPGFVSNPQISFGQNAGGGTAAAGPSFSGTISSLFPKLDSFQTAGYARILKTSTLVVKSGEVASLRDTKQIPIAAPAQATTPPTPQTVGLDISVNPMILGQSEDIELKVKVEQTTPIGRAPAGSAVLTTTHKIETKLYVKSNESAALAGVQSSDVGTDFNKDDVKPGSNGSGSSEGGVVSDTLFNLQRSKSYRKAKSQFVIFITPQIVENASEGTEDLKKNFRIKVK